MLSVNKLAAYVHRFATLCVTGSLVAALPNLAQAAVVFNAVAAGDPNTDGAVIWTRATDTAQVGSAINLTLQIATDSGFTNIAYTKSVATNPTRDYSSKTTVTGLSSGTRYYYRFQAADGTFSLTGTFKTAPARNQQVAVRFGFSGDADGQWRPYASTQTFPSLNLDFFVFLGDTIYETATAGNSSGTGKSAVVADAYSNPTQALIDYHRKYLENISPVNSNGYSSLQTMFAAGGNYTLLDNHELGNKQFINGGAPSGSPLGASVDATNTAFDVNTTGAFINQSPGFKTLVQAYSDYQPIRERTISVPSDTRTDKTQDLYYSQQWGKNCIFINVDDRSYRDIRLKNASGDDTGVRASNSNRTMLGATQLAWLENTLSFAQVHGITWKFVAVSSPIDELGNLGNVGGPLGTVSDGGKSWMGGYRYERNILLKYIADNGIKNVVFITTDDHQNRINELTYFTGITNYPPTGRVLVPNTFIIVAGPIGAGGPDGFADGNNGFSNGSGHTFAEVKSVADNIANAQITNGVDPIGLSSSFPGLGNVYREGDPNLSSNIVPLNKIQPIDFYSPDTFNYVTFDISADGSTLSVNTYGINSYQANTFPEPDPVNNPVRKIIGFTVQAQ